MNDRASVSTKSVSAGRRLLAGGAWAFGAKSIGLFGGLVVNVLLARLLSTDAMGTYFLVISVAGLGAVLVRFGMQQTLVRFVAEAVVVGAGGRARQTVAKVGGITIIGSLLASLVLFSGFGSWLAYELFDAPSLAGILGLVAVLISALAFQTVVSESFRGLHQIRHASLFDTTLSTLVFALVLIVVWSLVGHLDLSGALLLFIAATLLTILTGGALLLGRLRALPGEGEVDISEILRTSSPMLVNNLASYLVVNFGLWVVGVYQPVSEVAVYGAVVRLVNLVSIPLLVVNMVVQPFIAEQNIRNQRDVLERVLRTAATLAALPGVVLLLVFIFASGDIMVLIFGEPYRDGGTILAIFSLGYIVNVWTGSCGNVLIFTGHQRIMMGITLVSGPISFLGALLLVTPMGAVGVALAMSIGLALQNLAAWWLVHRRVGIWTHASSDIPGLLKASREMIGLRRQ